MDGTLTVAVHDFDAIRRELDIQSGVPILEALEAMPVDEAAIKREKLDAIELEIAAESTPMPGAADLLNALSERDCRLGILTRNTEDSARVTLRACGFDHHFDTQDILHRDSCAPKPEPDGVIKLLTQWNTRGDDALILGDYLFDLQAGRRAGVASIHLDTSGAFPWPHEADLCVQALEQLI